MHNIPWGMGKELGFHRRNISKKGEKNCGSKLRLGTYIECTDLYRSHSATDQMSVVWAWGGGGGGGGGGWRGGGWWCLVVGFNEAFCKQMTSFKIQSYISVLQLPKQQQI